MISERRLQLILIFLAAIIICGWLTLFYIQSMNSSRELTEEKLHNITYLELLKKAIINNIIAGETIEKIFIDKLELAQDILQKQPPASKLLLQELCRKQDLEEISFIYHNGQVINSNLYKGIYPHDLSQLDLQIGESTVLALQADTLRVFGSRILIEKTKMNYFVGAVSDTILFEHTKDISLANMIDFVKGSILENEEITESNHALYVVIQDSLGIIAATSNITFLKRLQDDEFLSEIYNSRLTDSRFTLFKGERIMETVTPFKLNDYDFGVIRLGVKLKRFYKAQINKRIVLFLFSFIFLFSLFLEYLFYRNYKKLQRSKDELNSSRRVVEIARLGGEVAHEIKNPLNSIYMILQRLQMEFEVKKKGEEFAGLLEISYSEIERLNKIVEQFLSLSRKLEIRRQPVDVNRLITTMVDLFGNNKKGVRIIYKSQKIMIFPLDEKLLRQVIINLLKNALEAFDRIEDKNEIVITTVRQKHNLVISIRDNGSGILKDDLAQIWDLYFTTKNSGNGIGLALSKKIVDAHGGRIFLENTDKKGSEFRIELPAIWE